MHNGIVDPSEDAKPKEAQGPRGGEELEDDKPVEIDLDKLLDSNDIIANKPEIPKPVE